MHAQELDKAVNKKIKKRKVYVRFKSNVPTAGLAKMISISSKKCGCNIYNVPQIFPLNMFGFNLQKIKMPKKLLMVSFKQ